METFLMPGQAASFLPVQPMHIFFLRSNNEPGVRTVHTNASDAGGGDQPAGGGGLGDRGPGAGELELVYDLLLLLALIYHRSVLKAIFFLSDNSPLDV